MKVCQVAGCEGRHRAKGYCGVHYNRAMRGTDLGAQVRPWARRGPVCTVDGCPHAPLARGLCTAHYGRMQRHGSPLDGTFVDGMPEPTCSICAEPLHQHGYCRQHHARWFKYGDPTHA